MSSFRLVLLLSWDPKLLACLFAFITNLNQLSSHKYFFPKFTLTLMHANVFLAAKQLMTPLLLPNYCQDLYFPILLVITMLERNGDVIISLIRFWDYDTGYSNNESVEIFPDGCIHFLLALFMCVWCCLDFCRLLFWKVNNWMCFLFPAIIYISTWLTLKHCQQALVSV